MTAPVSPSDRGPEPDLLAAVREVLVIEYPLVWRSNADGAAERALAAAGRVLAERLFADARGYLDTGERLAAASEFTEARNAMLRGTMLGVTAHKIERLCGVPEGGDGGGESG